MINEVKLDKMLKELGFPEILTGTDHIRQAVHIWSKTPYMKLAGELYPAIAAAAGAAPAQVERRMRHAIERAWQLGDPELQRETFGWTYSAELGRPNVGLVVAQLARVCREN